MEGILQGEGQSRVLPQSSLRNTGTGDWRAVFPVDSDRALHHRCSGSPSPREDSPKLLEHFAVESFEKLLDEQLSKRRRERNLTPQNMDWPYVRRFLRHPHTAACKRAYCQMVNQTVTISVCLAERGFEIV